MNVYFVTLIFCLHIACTLPAHCANREDNKGGVLINCIDAVLTSEIERFENEGGAIARASAESNSIRIRWTERVETRRSRVGKASSAESRFDSNFRRIANLVDSNSHGGTIIIPARWGRGKTELGNDLVNWWQRKNSGHVAGRFSAPTRHFDVYGFFLEFGNNLQPPIGNHLLEEWTDTVPWQDGFRAGIRYLHSRGISPLFIIDEFGYSEPYASEVLEAFASAEGAHFVVLEPKATTASAADRFSHYQQLSERIGPRLRATTLEPESIENVRFFLNQIVRGTSVRFSEEAVRAIYESSGGWPYEINAILLELPENVPIINRTHILNAVREAQTHSGRNPYEFHID